jgi:asparagine synthase (glutamine-hydrolysing)
LTDTADFDARAGARRMCGIAVAINWDGAEAAVRRLITGLLHRGDVTDPLVTIGNTVAMCTRRLRIVDASNGVQPQTSFDGRFLVSFNGEIYNHVALRDQLETLGVRFRTQCDTEVIANVLATWGAEGVRRLSGYVRLRGDRYCGWGFRRCARPFWSKAALFDVVA